MTRLLCGMIVALTLALPVWSARAADSVVSSYTKQLIDLMNVFAKLDQAAANRMTANERYLMAKAMLRLSGGFYQLMIQKEKFVHEVQRSVGAEISPEMPDAVMKLRDTLDCLTAQLNDKGARVGAFVGFDGPAVGAALRNSIDERGRSLDAIMEKLGMDPSTPNLVDDIVRNGLAAKGAAEALHLKTAEFAHVLDPSVVPPEHPQRCVKPSENP